MPPRSISAPRLVDSRAAEYGVPSSPRAEATSVEVTHFVVVTPSTVSSSGRAKRMLILLPSSTGSSSEGATMSRSVTSMSSDSRISPTVSPMARTFSDWPSIDSVTEVVSAA